MDIERHLSHVAGSGEFRAQLMASSWIAHQEAIAQDAARIFRRALAREHGSIGKAMQNLLDSLAAAGQIQGY